MSKHTPGPWSKAYISGALRHVQRNVDIDAFLDGESIDEINNGLYETPSGRSVADAALIAAAPEMLAALEECSSILRLLDPLDSPGGSEKLSAAIARAVAAIARATGES